MKTLPVQLDDELDAAREAVCKDQGRDKASVESGFAWGSGCVVVKMTPNSLHAYAQSQN